MTIHWRKKLQPLKQLALWNRAFQNSSIDRNPGPRINDHPRVGDILQLGVTSSTAQRYTAKVQKIERSNQVRDVHGLPDLLETGLPVFCGRHCRVPTQGHRLRSSLLWPGGHPHFGHSAISAARPGTAGWSSMTTSHTSVLCGESTSLGSSQSQEFSARP